MPKSTWNELFHQLCKVRGRFGLARLNGDVEAEKQTHRVWMNLSEQTYRAATEYEEFRRTFLHMTPLSPFADSAVAAMIEEAHTDDEKAVARDMLSILQNGTVLQRSHVVHELED